jgi:hypothetical protein
MKTKMSHAQEKVHRVKYAKTPIVFYCTQTNQIFTIAASSLTDKIFVGFNGTRTMLLNDKVMKAVVSKSQFEMLGDL